MTTCTICRRAPAVPLSVPPTCQACGLLDDVTRQIEFPPDIERDDRAIFDLAPEPEFQPGPEGHAAALARIAELEAALQESIKLGDEHLLRLQRALRWAWIRDNILFGLWVAGALLWWF